MIARPPFIPKQLSHKREEDRGYDSLVGEPTEQRGVYAEGRS